MPLTSLLDDDTTLVYLIRHGATEHNEMRPPRLQGAGVNGPLSERGRAQAERTAGLLAERPIKAVFASPMIRAVETATTIAQPHQHAVQTIDSLIEVNVGDWEGLTWDQVREQHPESYAQFMGDAGVSGYPGGETLEAVIDRTSTTLAKLMSEWVGHEIVVVAHSVVNRSYLGSLLGLTPARGYHVPQENCAVNVVRWKNGKAKAVSVNGLTHLMS